MSRPGPTIRVRLAKTVAAGQCSVWLAIPRQYGRDRVGVRLSIPRETGDTGMVPNEGLAVTPADLRRVRAAIGKTDRDSLNHYDFNRDGLVNVLDLAVVKANLGRSLPQLSPAQSTASGATSVPNPPLRPERRRQYAILRGVLLD